MKTHALLLTLILSAPALAEGDAPKAEAPAESPELKEATEVLTKYLDLVKAKKWADAKKLIHPKTMAVIAERKKRLGKESHPMAPWALEKTDYWMKAYKLGKARPGPHGTVVIETSEDNFQVEEKGLAEGDPASYLLGKTGGKWFVVDKVRGGGFSDDGIKLGYKGWFDKVEKKDE
jgi:hypothetical protein